jgi:hypothetical protein
LEEDLSRSDRPIDSPSKVAPQGEGDAAVGRSCDTGRARSTTWSTSSVGTSIFGRMYASCGVAMLRCCMPNLTKVSCSVVFEQSGNSGSQVWCVGWAGRPWAIGGAIPQNVRASLTLVTPWHHGGKVSPPPLTILPELQNSARVWRFGNSLGYGSIDVDIELVGNMGNKQAR